MRITRNLLIALLFGATTSLAAGQAAATVIYDNGTFNPSNAGAFNSEGTAQRLADDFVLGSAATLRSTQFWGSHWTSGAIPAVEDFTVIIYGNQGGIPDVGNVIGTSVLTLVSRVDTGFNQDGHATADILEYTMDLVTPIALSAGTLYWFNMYLATDAPNTTFQWTETGANGSGNLAYTQNAGVSFNGHSNALSFNLSDNFAAVPEPGTGLLMSLGLVGLTASRRR